MNWVALNEALILRRRLELLVKFRKSVPGIMAAQRHYVSCRALGPINWFVLQRRFDATPTAELEERLQMIDKEIDLRLSMHMFELPI